jgi:hypothetical protein
MTGRLPLYLLVVAASCGGKSTTSSAMAVATTCPEPVTATVSKTYPTGTLGPCRSTRDDGKDVYEVSVTVPDGAPIEVELSVDGVITETEQVVLAMPDPVAAGFAAKYPGATASRIERQTEPGKSDTFELRVGDKDATFTAAGEFVAEQKADAGND